MSSSEAVEIGEGYKLYQDTDPQDPRDNDNLGTMVCWHRNYSLGDEQPNVSVTEWLESRLELSDVITARLWKKAEKQADAYAHTHDREKRNPSYWYKEELMERFEKTNIVMPLFLYDHSGITMNTTGYSCPWDSGQVGIIYASYATIRKEYGNAGNKNRTKAMHLLGCEVKEYDDYLTGDVYGYVTDIGESCWGYYGLDECRKAAEEAVKAERAINCTKEHSGEEEKHIQGV